MLSKILHYQCCVSVSLNEKENTFIVRVDVQSVLHRPLSTLSASFITNWAQPMIGPCGKLAHISKYALQRNDKTMSITIKINKLFQLFSANTSAQKLHISDFAIILIWYWASDKNFKNLLSVTPDKTVKIILSLYYYCISHSFRIVIHSQLKFGKYTST